MRALMTLGVVLLLAACSASGRPVSTAKTGPIESKVGEAVEWSNDELIDYISELTDGRLRKICGGKQSIRTQRDCLRDALFRGFDTDGQARARCDRLRDLDQFGRCVILGTLVQESIGRSGMPGKDDFDWAAEGAELERLGSELGEFLAQACIEGDLSALDRCFLDSFARTFGVRPEISGPCYRIEDTDEAAHCLLRVSFVDRFETAVKRMGPAGDIGV